VETFGQALRRWREATGLSQPELARRVPVSQASVSRWESGKQSVDSGTAGQLDDMLGANGELVALHQSADPARILNSDDHDRVVRITEKPRTIDRRGLDSLAAVLAEYRRMEDSLGVGAVFDPTRAHLRLMRRAVLDARGSLRPAIVDLAAQWAQFAGWLHAATGQHDAANTLFGRALEFAIESDNITLQANALSYKGHLAWMLGQVGPMMGLSQAAQRSPNVHISQRAFDAMQEARAHALAGDADTAHRALGTAEERIDEIRSSNSSPAPWSYYYSSAFWTLQRGLVHQHLGENAPAADLLQSGLDSLPQDQQSADWTGDYRRALAAAQAEL
jgi:transcriptional regulator with XRE-family HTH domain